MGLLPMDSCLCWKIKTATIAVFIYVAASASLAALFEILDIAALNDPNFEIVGGFKSSWRAHVWEGWLACNIVMMLCHFIMIAYSVLMIFAVKRFPTFYEFNLTKGYMAAMIMYMIIELGTSCYRYSWYGPNIFRLGYLVFTFLYWILRTITNTVSLLVIYSRTCEVQYEIRYGEKKMLDGWTSDSRGANTMDTPLMSGAVTPLTPRGGGPPVTGAPNYYA